MRPGKALLPIALGLDCALSLLCAPFAEARVEAEAHYSKAQTYSAALRYLRVDLGYEVMEKDADAAYLEILARQTTVANPRRTRR